MKKVTAYFSHSIRGAKGDDATEEDITRNCAAAEEAANWIRENIPEIDLYVPAEHEDFVHIAWKDKYLTESEILVIDCKILGKRDLHIVHFVDSWKGGGIGVEIDHAKKVGVPIFYLETCDVLTRTLLRNMAAEILERKGK